MLNIKRNFDYPTVIKYALFFFACLLFNKLESEVMPYSVAVFAAAVAGGFSLIVTPILFILSFIIMGGKGLILSALCSALIMTVVVFIYKKAKVKPSYETALYALASLVMFLISGNTEKYVPFENRVLVAVITAILTFLCVVSGKVIAEKGLKFKLGYEEFAAIGTVSVALGLGLCNALSPVVYKGLAVFLLLFACFIYRLGVGTLIAAILGVPLAIYYGNLTYASVFLCLGIIAESVMPITRYLSALGVLVADYLIEAFFNISGGYSLILFLPTFIGAFLFSSIPKKPFNALKEKLYTFREKQLVRQAINRNRLMTSNRLYELSGVFNEMAEAFSSFKKAGLTAEKAKKIIRSEIYTSVCKECERFNKCKAKESSFKTDMEKMLDIGFAKGKLSLIDLPANIGDTCTHPNNILFAANKLLADYRSYNLNFENVNTGRDLIAKEAAGVSEILKGLAFETGTVLKYQNKTERKLADGFMKKGLLVSEILVYGEGQNVAVSLIIAMKEFTLSDLHSVLKKTLGVDMILCDKTNVTDDKCFLSFKVAVNYDAVFGISSLTKDGSVKSGDTHSVARIADSKFLIALSDGMGSGERAENISSVSLSLIESFYKAGLKSELILSTVNRLLSVNEEDDFTALDIAVVDLKERTADFIKYGCPYGFIIGEDGIKIVEGNSLPLGILSELKPSVCTADICDGDMILLLTDGISDAFGSSGAIIDYIRNVPAKNPQSFSEQLLSKAVELNDGVKKDDMTALAVRIYKRSCSQSS